MARSKTSEINAKFYIEQITTTKIIIKQFSNTKEFSPTMLLNSLLSLVIWPFESAKKANRERIFPGSYKDFEKKLGFSPDIFQPIKNCENGKPEYNKKTIYKFINKFRNGIAHRNLSVTVDKDRIIHISISNIFYKKGCKSCQERTCTNKGLNYINNGIVDFKITVTVPQLQKLALYVADAYLKAIQG